MKIHRFIIPTHNLKQGEEIIIDDERVVRQAGRVLRLQKDEYIGICDGSGVEALVRIESIDKKYIRGRIESLQTLKFNLRETVLYCALIKKDNFELVVQKATELGVSAIIPVISERVVKLGLRLDRLQSIALESAEQSGRGEVPQIYGSHEFPQAINHAKKENKQNILFHMSGKKIVASDLDAGKTGIFIGPEGGFSESEIQLATDAGFQILSLSPLTLRAETAAIVALHTTIYC